ncbi:hypothetical protein [Enterococcus sp. CSURQ0835]|uniref:hypothetical protein n=1 Tax=Enterococcus sp. CSURQ0835 TaxID=2681394 RepID=UPI00135C7501|nr:hypothetical protein [Enterococcus sp. CSURQ0835]
MLILTKTIQENTVNDLQTIVLALIPIFGTIVAALVGYLINKNMEMQKEINSKKRKIYEEFLNAVTLTQFEGSLELLIIPGSDYAFKDVHTAKLEVIKGYEKVKLWGSKGVINACYDFFESQIRIAQKSDSVSQKDMKEAYYRIIEEMRNDLKMKKISLNEKTYKLFPLIEMIH